MGERRSVGSGPCLYLGPLLPDHGAGLALAAAHSAGLPIVLAGTAPSAKATAYSEVELRPRLAQGDVLLEQVESLERWDLLADAGCMIAPLHPEVACSLEVVEAMAYGTPVVTMIGTVGAELVCHGVAGLVLDDPGLLPEAVAKSGRLDPARVREHAASHFDLPAMVSAYERLFADARVLYFQGATYMDYLLGSGILRRRQVDGSYDGSPSAFVASGGQIAVQAYATNEPYTYQHEITAWGKPVAYQLVYDTGYPNYANVLAVRADRQAALARCLARLVPLCGRPRSTSWPTPARRSGNAWFQDPQGNP